MMTVKFKKTSEKAIIPVYAHPGEDACFDLRVLINDDGCVPFRFIRGEKAPLRDTDRQEDADGNLSGAWINPGQSIVFHTGLSCELPAGYVMKIYARSSTGIKNHLMLSNGTGIIDSGYRGEIHVALTNFGDRAFCINDGDRVAQAEICKIVPVSIVEATELSDSSRGACGIGSTGNN